MRPLFAMALLLAFIAPAFAAQESDCERLAKSAVMERAETQLGLLARALTDVSQQKPIRAKVQASDATLLETTIPAHLRDIRELQALQRDHKLTPAQFQKRFTALHFVADEIRGTFEAIVGASVQQMESYADLVDAAGKTAKELADARCGTASDAKRRTTTSGTRLMDAKPKGARELMPEANHWPG